MYLFSLSQQPYAGQGHLVLDVSRSHTLSDAYQALGILKTNDRPVGVSQRPVPDNTQSHDSHVLAQAGCETAVSASEWPRILALDRSATGTGI